MPTAIKNVTLHDVALHNALIRPAFFLQIALSVTDAQRHALVAELRDNMRILTFTQTDTSYLTSAGFTLLKQI